MELLSDPNVWMTLLTLTVLEIVLGIDNVIFISLLADRLEGVQRRRARQIGLGLAMLLRIALLGMIYWITKLTQPLFTILEQQFSWRDVILFVGGLFLIAKATIEIHHSVEGDAERSKKASGASAFFWIIVQILALDLVFSIDSVLTAIGLAEQLSVMILAIVIAVAVMYFASGPTSNFIRNHPTTKMLALSFLLMIGLALIADALDFHIPRAYLYSAMVFSVMVEALNLAAASRLAQRAKNKTDKMKKSANESEALI